MIRAWLRARLLWHCARLLWHCARGRAQAPVLLAEYAWLLQDLDEYGKDSSKTA